MNDNQSPPSLEQWRSLYNAALKFKELAPWEWMWDSQLFGVMNPVTEEIGYCCIMGKLGEHYALAVYQGTDGLEGYLHLQSGKLKAGDDDLLTSQKCLMASFEDNQFLSKEDKMVIKDLGLMFRGRHAWPLFRNYAPGYYPWFLTPQEVGFLTLCLEQALEVSAWVKDNPDFIIPQRKNEFFVRVPQRNFDKLTWSDQWLQPSHMEKVIVMHKNVDDQQLEKISRFKTAKGMIWEIDQSFFPTVVREKNERPFYPLAFLFVERESDFILNVHVSSPQKFRSEFIDQFIVTLENTGVLPEEIHLKNKDLSFLLEPFVCQFGIRLELVKKFEVMERVKKEMRASFSARS